MQAFHVQKWLFLKKVASLTHHCGCHTWIKMLKVVWFWFLKCDIFVGFRNYIHTFKMATVRKSQNIWKNKKLLGMHVRSNCMYVLIWIIQCLIRKKIILYTHVQLLTISNFMLTKKLQRCYFGIRIVPWYFLSITKIWLRRTRKDILVIMPNSLKIDK